MVADEKKISKPGEEAQPVIKIEPPRDTAPARTPQPSVFTRELGLLPPNIRDMATFCRQLATLLDVGIPLLRSLKILSERTQHPRLKKVVGEVAKSVEEGQSLSSALAKFPRVFSPLFVNVVKVGEVGGILESSLKRLADILEKKADIKKKIFSAVAYPVAALLMSIGIIILMLVVAIPRFEQVYKEQAAQLPGVTRIILAVSHFVQDYPLIYVPLLVVAIVLLIAYGRTPVGRRMYDWLKLKLPIMGPINVKINVARFTRTAGGLLAAGIPLLEVLNVAFRTAENVVVAEAIKQTHDNVERGGKMDEPLRKNPVFPPLVVDMIAIGDEAGALDMMLNKIADVYETDVDASLKGLTALIEPLLIVFLGFVVIFIALGLLLPYWNLVRVIGEK